MSSQELEKSIKDILTLFEETDRQFKETSRQFKETDRRFKETDRRFKETDKQFKETDRKVELVNKSVEALTGKWGRFVEGLLVPAVENLFKTWGIIVDKVYQRVKVHKNGSSMEVDILAINGEYAVLIEAKSTLSVNDIQEHLSRLSKFKSFFPEYANRKSIGAVAGIVIDEGADRYAYQNGLFVIGQSGETVRILNDKNFQPREW